MKHFQLQITAEKMGLQSLRTIVLLVLSAEASAAMLSLNFVESYMTMYKLKFPLFVLHPSDLDAFYEEMANMTFQTFSCYCYEEGKVIYSNENKEDCYKETFQTKICKE